MEKIRAVLADDHALVRAGLRELLQALNNVTVVGEAGDGIEAIEQAKGLHPDILILDIQMPLMGGIEAIREIKRISPETQILVLSMHSKEEYVRQTLKNGASGYLLKQSASDDLKNAIAAITSGSIYLSPSISRSIVSAWLKEGDVKTAVKSAEGELTEREKGVLKLLAEGLSNKRIAELLHISVKTVETHRHRIMDKLKLHSVADLVKYAIKEGLTELE